ncbi:hypothetical protein HR45_16555 [Shewanella mangrovi]|uniref:Uncharacterized protein n=1 Tax=Shewanella mangrovi TaxID=1515746 RepID=A0A094JVG6_9GAMM|nr:hypothetical protein [Shewanella mangrovi]KFZ36426.1 hypothetical protein HR45_16555 [Shewanella mangrovi]
MKLLNPILATLLLACSTVSYAAENTDNSSPLTQLQQLWAENNYQLKGDAQEKAFESLLKTADETLKSHTDDANILIWHGIINSTFAGVTGGLSALKYAKIAKKDFEQALKINPEALHGSAYTSLGVLYFKVPGWPIGFGDDDKAQELLQKALTLNPDGIDSNYFYAEFLRDDDKYQQAKQYYQKALAAAPRVGREVADAGRRQEIETAMADVEKHLKQ